MCGNAEIAATCGDNLNIYQIGVLLAAGRRGVISVLFQRRTAVHSSLKIGSWAEATETCLIKAFFADVDPSLCQVGNEDLRLAGRAPHRCYPGPGFVDAEFRQPTTTKCRSAFSTGFQ